MDNSIFKILIADDEPDILEFISFNLQKEKFQVYTAQNGREAIALSKKVIPHLIILDIMMPEIDGVEVCRELKTIPELNHSIIVFLTARNEAYSEIAAFEAGADDYIVKPVRINVFINRVKALLRRHQVTPHLVKNIYTLGPLEIDEDKYILKKNGEIIPLPKKEFEILKLLATKPGKVFRRNEIFNKIWGEDIIVGKRTIDVHIRKLREKIGDDIITTIKGVGYKIDVNL